MKSTETEKNQKKRIKALIPNKKFSGGAEIIE